MSLLERLKGKLRRKKLIPENSDHVSDIIAETTKKIADEKDLRVIQSRLLAQQLQYKKDKPIRELVARAQTLAHRARIRRPLKSAIVHQGFADHEGRIYLELSSGQSVRVDKPHRSLHLRNLIHTHLTGDLEKAGVKVSENVERPA